MSDYISFLVNGKQYKLETPNPSTSLNTWLRSTAGLTGTKVMCEEGGCGCCVVTIERPSEAVKAVNSCLLPLCAVDGCHITTVEGIGSKREGFNKIQSRIAEFGGSQCGYCTPGFVMSMHSLLQNEESPKQQTIEDNFDGHICRCTGYRSILDAMKCFACDADEKLKTECQDIEDLIPEKCFPSEKKEISASARWFRVNNDITTWIRPSSLDGLKTLLKEKAIQLKGYKLVCGNTGTGVYKPSCTYAIQIDISQIPELRTIVVNSGCIEFGAGVTLNEIIKTLNKQCTSSVTFEPLAKHLKKVASLPIRNAGSWAGNVVLKCQHPEFPSDVCTLLEAAISQVQVYDVISNETSSHSIYGDNGLISLDLKGKVLLSLSIPMFADERRIMRTFKVMPRSQNALAYVNAAFHAQLSDDAALIGKCLLVYGGISNKFARALKTEEFLRGKEINNDTLHDALNSLTEELKQVGAENYKLNLSLALFYKFFLSMCDPSKLSPGVESAIHPLVRPISKGTQIFDTNPKTYPVSKALPKLSAKLQASGEAQYISDRAVSSDELHCTFVVSEVANAELDGIDDTVARSMPGFVHIITGMNFPPEVNNTYLHPWDDSQPMITTGSISYAGQVVAIVIAESAEQARLIAKAVKVSYKNIKKPLLSTRDAIEQESFYPLFIPTFEIGDPDEAITNAKHVVSGEFDVGSQYHFYMETQVCRAACTEEGGFEIEVATQVQSWLQDALSYAFHVPHNKIELSTKRVGGAYGGKAVNSMISGAAASLAAYITRRPVRFHGDLTTCMSTFGSRTPYAMKYKLGFNDAGLLQGMDCNLYTNSGCSSMDDESSDPTILSSFADSAYFCANRRYNSYACKTNLPSSTWCRAPGSIQLTGFADLMMEHIASYLGKDPIDVKFTNLYKKGQIKLNGDVLIYCQIREIYQELLQKYEVKKRQEMIKSFNDSNKWKKKGLAITPVKYGVLLDAAKYSVLMTIYAGDGTVVISHGGIESGQGINTKVAQVAAYKLDIPIDLISVQRSSTITAANSDVTGGSVTSEITCKSVIGCCELLNSRIAPIRAKMAAGVKWKTLIAQCFSDDVDLTVSHMNPILKSRNYSSYGVTCAQVDYDVLTGEYQIEQVDTIFDCGMSLNPMVDIGQVEGAFVMGIGFWTSEYMAYDENNGQLLTNNTWKYKPPASKDIPVEWNIELLKNAPNPLGILRSKASGEPPMCMSVCVAHALKCAVEASKRDRGLTDYFPLPTPATVEALHDSSQLEPLKDFSL